MMDLWGLMLSGMAFFGAALYCWAMWRGTRDETRMRKRTPTIRHYRMGGRGPDRGY